MTTDERSLLLAIRDNAEDDMPRLAYADWLEEQGGEESLRYAAFIRGQIAEPDTALEVVANKKAGRVVIRVIAGLQGFNPFRADDLDVFSRLLPWGGRLVISRGFPARCLLSIRGWLRAGTAIFARYPIRSAQVKWACVYHHPERLGSLSPEMNDVALQAMMAFTPRSQYLEMHYDHFKNVEEFSAFITQAICDTLLSFSDNNEMYQSGVAEGICFPLATHPLAIDARKSLYRRLDVSYRY